jgi:succinate dehydrogenase / fumarate reductase iron-sulfur subunit
MEKSLTLRIKRTSRPRDGEDIQYYWQDFHVNVSEQDYVLDALESAWKQDPSLMFRHSCHHASCGSCGILIQGREKLACVTPAFSADRRGVLHLEPLHNFPVVADLVVDMGSLAQKLERVKAQAVTESDNAQRFESCIECGLCISACPISATNEIYLGPAVLAAARNNIDSPEVRQQVESRDGIWRCHGAFECTEVCPAGVEPAASIIYLRKELLTSMIKRKGK